MLGSNNSTNGSVEDRGFWGELGRGALEIGLGLFALPAAVKSWNTGKHLVDNSNKVDHSSAASNAGRMLEVSGLATGVLGARSIFHGGARIYQASRGSNVGVEDVEMDVEIQEAVHHVLPNVGDGVEEIEVVVEQPPLQQQLLQQIPPEEQIVADVNVERPNKRKRVVPPVKRTIRKSSRLKEKAKKEKALAASKKRAADKKNEGIGRKKQKVSG